MPPQPEGLWQVVYNGDNWVTSKGEDKYRRGLYTFWRRTNPHPAMTTFDAPSREVVDKIAAVPTGAQDRPATPVVIESVTVTRDACSDIMNSDRSPAGGLFGAMLKSPCT